MNESHSSAERGKTLLAQVRTMVFDSGVYFVADGAARAVNLVLVLTYTRFLAPTGYGILAITSSVTQLLVPILGMAIVAAVTRLYFENTSEERRRQLYVTTLAFLVIVPTTSLAVIEGLGRAGALDLFRSTPYDPYLRLAVLAAYFSVFIDLPVAVYIARHQSRRVAALTLVNALLLLGSSVVMVVGLHKGVRGVLLASVLSSAAMALVGIVLSLRLIGHRVRPSGQMLTAMLFFSLPLAPHAVAQWVLQTSDRLILSRYVSSSSVGLYYIGYSIGSIATFLVFAMTKAMSPIVTAELKANGDSARVRRLGTYWYAVIAVGCLIVAMYGSDAIKIIAPVRFHGAVKIVPIIALASAVYGIYSIVSSALWYSMRTGWIPAMTGASASINVGLNFLLIPRYGIEAAAWNTLAGFAALALLQGGLASRSYHISWEYRRWAVLSLVLLVGYLTVQLAAPEVGIRRYVLSSLLIVLIPLVLSAIGFWSAEERHWLRRHLPKAVSWMSWVE